MKVASGVNKITNSGTIDTATQADDARGVAVKVDQTNDTLIENSGTIHGGNMGLHFQVNDFEINNTGTISSNNPSSANIYKTRFRSNHYKYRDNF